MITFDNNIVTQRLENLKKEFQALIEKKNEPENTAGNGIYTRYKNPIITAAHTPLEWRYDFDPNTNPLLLERIGINATFNAGALKWNNKYITVVRVEGVDRKSFFAILGQTLCYPSNRRT